ncbi:MAG: Rrf2 family transcriptional regulator [Planctomycetales bacterium]
MKLSRTILYALQATLHLAESETHAPVPCSQLAKRGQMPERFLLQILRNLVTHGLLRSTRGVEGGYSLQRNAEDISLLDLIEAIDGPMIAELPRENGLSLEAAEKVQGVIQGVNNQLREDLGSIRLPDMMTQPVVADQPESVKTQPLP